MIKKDLVKIVIDVIINLPLLIALILWADYTVDKDYDIEIKIEDVTFKGEYIYRKLWEIATGKKLNEVKENE